MNSKVTTSPRKPFGEKVKRFHFCFLVLGLLVFPTSSLAAYISGPPEILSALQFDFQGEVNFDSEFFSQGHLISIDPSSGRIAPSELNTSNGRNIYGQVKPGGSEVDPFSDAAIVDEEDPFGDDAEDLSNLEEDPFAEEEEEIDEMPDPLERWFNRPVYEFNDAFYEYLMRPVAETYRDIVAENYRIMLRNLYDTVVFPGRFVSSLLQFKFEKAGRVLGRTLINCTLGFVCMVDVANEGFEIKPVDEDFGQVLGYYGISSGPYLVLPILGPSSVRDGIGRAADAVMNPLFWVVPDFLTAAGITTGRIVNETSFFIEDVKALKESAIDPYISIRDFYNQRREILVNE